MKAITIKQPWASLICKGVKDIENRTWPTKFRGRVLIHASAKQLDSKGLFSIEKANEIPEELFEKIDSNKLITGAIIGSVEIVDCVLNHESIWAEESFEHFIEGDRIPIASKKTYNWVLANPIKFPEPIPAKGKLSFWDYPNILAEPEEKNGELFCHCQLPVKEINQVTGDSRFGYCCRYCGGKWYK